jgi:hypothetical protein
MISMHRNTLLAALVGALAVAASAGRASAQAADTTSARQGKPSDQAAPTNAPNPPDTSGYAKFKGEMGKAGDTIKPTGKTVNYRKHKVYKSKDTTSGGATPEGAAMPPNDTSGYTKFKREMGKAGDTLHPPRDTTINYRQGGAHHKGKGAHKPKGAAKPSTGADTAGMQR